MSEPKYEKINFNRLKLDDNNPRLPKSMHSKSEEEIIEYMLLEASTIELMQAIGENGFFAGEQLLVVKENDNTYCVVEGNRRLVAVKLLNNPSLAKVQKIKVQKVFDEAEFYPTSIPCLIFDEKDEILRYLGYRHITGIKSWKLLEKARYLYQLKHTEFPETSFKQACRDLAKMIGSRRDYVERIIIGYEVYQKIEDAGFYKILGLNDTTFYFNYIADSLSRTNIRDFLGIDLSHETPISNLNLKNLKKWTSWLFEKNNQNKTRLIGDSSHLNKLNKVLGNVKALNAFERGESLDKSFELTEETDKIFANSIRKSLEYLEQANSLTHKLNEFLPSCKEDLSSIRKLARNLEIIKERSDDEF